MGRLPNIHPGEVIREEWLVPLGKSKYWLAKGLRISATAVGEILAGKRGITALTALRLSRFLGCSPDFWLGLQASYDLEEAWLKHGEELREMERYDGSEPDPYPAPIPVEEEGASITVVSQ
jgi:antitoxin HigA-1